MTTETKVNVNTVHLVPAAAVWQAPKIIFALLKVATTSFWTLFFLLSLGFVLSHTTFFNSQKRAMMDDYDLCISTFKLNPDFTSRQEALAVRKCYAEAKRRSLLSQSR
jgi:hypothetical protein